MALASIQSAVDLFEDPLRSAVKSGILGVPNRETYFSLSRYMDGVSATLSMLGSKPDTARVFTNAAIATLDARIAPRKSRNVIIGGGLHGMILAWNLKGQSVLADVNLGGTFAQSKGATYFLNSRNRPGDGGKPGKGDALNYFPGAPFQMSSINGREYQTNADMAFAIIANLVLQAKLGWCAESVRTVSGGNRNKSLIVELPVRGEYITERVFFATGPGKERVMPGQESNVIYRTFSRFMERIARDPLSLVNVKNVAVLGAGDSGKVAVEALLGLGPVSYPSSAIYINHIDWYGQDSIDYDDFIQNNRVRYHQIAQSFPRYTQGGERECYSRITSLPWKKTEVCGDRVIYTTTGEPRRVVGGKYDLIIDCTGFDPFKISDYWSGPTQLVAGASGKPIARKAVGEEIYFVGPCAQLPASVKETVGIPENTIAAWRYTAKTAELARMVG
jgi:hypothetical protein